MWPDATQTQELLDQAKHGDAHAVDALLAKHREPIRRMIDMRLDPAIVQRLDASDVVQEVMIEASRRLQDYLKAPAMPFHLWLRHIAKDHLSDAHRRHHLTPASAAIQAEMQRRLQEAITQLDEDDREVILMRHYEMLANQEVAAALGLTEAAASMRYLRAVRKLRDLLAPNT